jgi:hypothetical protein
MAPRKPRTAQKQAEAVGTPFPTWDELTAEANVDKPPYQLPLPDGTVVEIPVPSGAAYLTIVDAQKRGDASTIFRVMFPASEQAKMEIHFSKVHFPIMDVIANKVLGYFYGLDNYASITDGSNDEDEAEEAAGESDGS